MVITGSLIEVGRTKLCKCGHSKRDHQLKVVKKKRLLNECLWHDCMCPKFIFSKEVPARSHLSPREPVGTVTLLHENIKKELSIGDM
jgi:hypothetical protein